MTQMALRIESRPEAAPTRGDDMQETRVLLVFPGSLYGDRWADGPRVKPELVQLFSELRRAGYEADVLDLEAEPGNPADDVARESLQQMTDLPPAVQEADLVVTSRVRHRGGRICPAAAGGL